jgi:class 3 adenylate cyclase
MIDTLETGRDAVRRHAWPDAVEALTAADRSGGLSPDDLGLLGNALWWSARPDEANEALERAFAAFSEGGRPVDAAGAALQLAYYAFRSHAEPVGMGWLARAQRLLADVPESWAHAWLLVFNTLGALMQGHIDAGIEAAGEAMEVARRTGNDSALFLAMSFRGMAKVFAGNVEDGLADIDEAAAAASSGQLELRTASDIYCNTISACRSVGDLARATQWAVEGERFMLREGAGGYPGICRVHRAELKMLHGQWAEAEVEARQACAELERFRLLDSVGYGRYQVGEIRLRMGDLDGAAAAFDSAYELGHDAQPGLALLQLARGEVADAGRSIDRALAAAAGVGGGAPDKGTRGRLLPAKIDIAIAAGDLEAARAAVEELESIATDYARPLFQAGALTARGELLLGEERPAEASPVLAQSWRMWQASDLPYESARARLRYAEALTAEGDPGTARRDLLAARSTFERLGAALDVEHVDALLGAESAGAGVARPADRVTRTFMFTDIVTSTDLLEAMGDEAWTEILAWHDRALRAAFVEHRGDEVSHTGDGFFVAFERAADGIACAVDIQRRLARHRREHGFAPFVRIGLHTAEATRRGRNFAGGGVHVAARVGGAAAKDEILVSLSALDAAGPSRFGLSEPRSMTLKGVRELIEVRAVDWR